MAAIDSLAILGLCNSDSPRLEAVLQRLKVSALDKLLREMIDRSDQNKDYRKYRVHMGTLDVMCDPLVTEALAVGMSVEQIVHTMFSCEDSLAWLHHHLAEDLHITDEPLRNNILNVLHLGVPVRHQLFAKALLLLMDEWIILDDSPAAYGVLDLQDYDRVSNLCMEEGGMIAYQHTDGVYQIAGRTTTWAVVPYHQGVKYYRRKQESCCFGGLLLKNQILNTTTSGAHIVQETINELGQLGCEDLLAWRLVTATVLTRPHVSVCSTVVQAFQVISGYRTELHHVILEAETHPIARNLLGSKLELIPKHWCGVDRQFFPENRLHATAKVRALDHISVPKWYGTSPLLPLGTNFLDLDPLETNLTLLKLIARKGRNSNVNKGKENQGLCRFSARTWAVLGAFDGNELYGAAVAKRLRQQYFYEDDHDHTASFYTPFSRLMIFASKDCPIIELPNQVQYPQSSNDSQIKNWIALRAAFEFDPKKGSFRYGTKEFQRAFELVDESVATFIHDTTRRFAQVFEASPARVTVSSLFTLCDKMAERTGCSSAWLVREMISRYIASGASVVNSGPDRNDGYGRMEMELNPGNYHDPSRKKVVLVFDCKVNIKGAVFGVDQCGTIWLSSCRPVKCISVKLGFRDEDDALDSGTAIESPEQECCNTIEVVYDANSVARSTIAEFHVVEKDCFV